MLRISLACGRTDRTAALFDGRVGVEGCRLDAISLGAEEAFHRSVTNKEFDVSELPFCTYIAQCDRDIDEYVGIPVFLGRSFRHGNIFIRSDRGIEAPNDLRGKVIGVPEYQQTACVWVRGILQDDFGLSPSDVEWRTGGVEQPGRKGKVNLQLPQNMRVEALSSGESLSDALARGELDALISARAPSCFTVGDTTVRRLFPDYRSVEREYFQRTKIFPIMHIVGVRKALLAANPWLAESVYKAFLAAKACAVAQFTDTTSSPVMLPWYGAELESTQKLMGDDFWPYGVVTNQMALTTLLGYMREQGIIRPDLSLERLFAAATVDRSRI